MSRHELDDLQWKFSTTKFSKTRILPKARREVKDINDDFSQVYPGWVQAAVDERTPRQAGWTESVAVGGKDFVEKVKDMPGGRACGRRVHT